ncbi:hypothetical protein OBBRIDRAFT_826227 [Obba rivulosa]|uniref:Uncharacterized protein n=1 Tax=Obba rivulosa TaxID=1052685 RepID=A0A8E2AX88_9APHY|nr:hypothetical protein OBBRIDRAFT_826227 [Obba rivulosa]
MLAFSFLAAALSLPAVIASPALRLRQVFPPGCGTGAPGDFDTTPSLSLAALNTTLPNSSSNGTPLVAAMTDIFGAQSNYVLATKASAEASLKFTVSDFSLETGALSPIVSNQNSADQDVSPGDPLEFSSSTGSISGPEIYCGIANTDPAGGGIPEPLLSLNGDTSDFSLCQSGELTVVVYEPTSDNFGVYDFDSCYGVDLLIFEH